jgi:hypothetical protein
MPKLTFSLDEETVAALRQAADRSGKPQSLVVREAIAEYAAREARLPAAEQARLLSAVRTIAARPATRPAADVDRELKEIRRSRAAWHRRSR